MKSGSVPTIRNSEEIDRPPWRDLEASFRADGRSVVYSREISEADDGWIAQCWTYYLRPVADGVEMLWVVETGAHGLPSFYGVQQCFRMSGRTNQAWRRAIADTPAFSEFDLWQGEASSDGKTSLTYVVRRDQWHFLPAEPGCVGARTPYGETVDEKRFGGTMSNTIGPYKARILDPVDCGLVMRADLMGEWVCGIYWEHTTHVTDHHPADCLHTVVDIGDIPSHGRRAIRGKIYWFQGTKADLLERWAVTFPRYRSDRRRWIRRLPLIIPENAARPTCHLSLCHGGEIQ